MNHWTSRVGHNHGTHGLHEVRDAARELADQAGRQPRQGGNTWGKIANAAIVGTVILSGASAAVHLWRELFPRHKEQGYGERVRHSEGHAPTDTPSHSHGRGR